MKYGKDLISRGASTTRTPAMTGVIFAKLRGTRWQHNHRGMVTHGHAKYFLTCAKKRIDPIFLRWIEDSVAGRTPQIDRIGISYMYFGAWQSKDGSSGHEFHVGPHLMIVGPHQDDFQGINRDPANGMPYVAHLPHRTELYLVMPVRQWN
jgi:hypothetical protein